MEHKNNERHLTKNRRQQMEQPFDNEGALAASALPALALMGLGKTATYLETHPKQLIAALRHSDWSVRTAAVQVLGKQGERGERAPIDLLLNALHDEHVSVRAMAARALGMQGQRTPLEPLLAALHDPEWRVRTAAALALGKLASRAPVEPLVTAMQDKHVSVRAAAVWALGAQGKRAPIEQLVAALHDSAWPVREAAAMALKEQGERAPLAQLLAAREDEDGSVREAAEAALDHRYYGESGQKLQPQSAGRVPSSWLHLLVAVISIVGLIPLTDPLISSGYIGRFLVVSQLIALGVVCLAISIINFLYQSKRSTMSLGQKLAHLGDGKSTVSWHGVILVGVSVLVLSTIVPTILNTGFAYQSGMTTDVMHFILVCRLIALGFVSLAVVAVNMVFHLKH